MKKVLFFFVFLGMISCSLNKWDDVPDCKSENDPFSVSMTDALSIASSFMTEKGIIPATRAEVLSVRKAFSIYDKTNDPLFHVVNYDGGGFVIVAGDMRLQPIQAYSPTGTFDDNKASYPLGLKIWLDCAEASRDNAMVENGEEHDDETQLAWMQFRSNGFDLNKRPTRSLDPSIFPPEEEIDTLAGPYINDSWHQDAPYNDSLQISAHYDQNGNAAGQYKPVVGSVPLAIARVLRYIKLPYNYSWSSMPNSVPQTVATLSFVRDVHNAVKTYANSHGLYFRYCRVPSYNNNVFIGYSSVTEVTDTLSIGAFLCDQYGYPAAITEQYSSGSEGKIRRELIDYHLPCILSGHSTSSPNSSDLYTWICDGYHYHFLPVFGPGGEYMGGLESKYLHHRWGQEGCVGDGWFIYYNYSTGGNNFNNYMKLTHRIAEIDYWSFGL